MDEQQPRSDAGDRPRDPDPPPADADPAGRTGRRKHRVAPSRRRPDVGRGITTAAVVVATVAGAGVLSVVAALLTLFGWGVAIVVAIAAVGGAAALRPRPANGWLLVPLLALALPAAAVGISGVRVSPDPGRVVEAPTSVAEIPSDGYRAGLGDLLIDLRGLRADGQDRVVVRGGSDLGRTVVALPQERCFHLDVRWRTGNLRLPRVRERPRVTGLRLGRALTRLGAQRPANRKRTGLASGRIALYGRAYGIAEGRWVAPTADSGAPTLTIELASEGGSFVVRDYPDRVSPLNTTGWPIDQGPFRHRTVDMAAAVRREARVVAAKYERAIRRGEIPEREIGRLRLRINAEAQNRVMRRVSRRIRDLSASFAPAWARRVTGTCNPRGTFR